MKKSTSKGKSAFKKAAPKKKADAKATKKKPEIEGLAEAEQPLFYYGPPPAIKTLYKKLEFDSKFHPQDLLKHMQEGSSRSEICAAWGVTYSKFNEWLDEHPELAEAYAVGKPSFDAYYKRALRHSAFGQMKSVREGSLFFMLKNLAGFDEGGGQHEFGDGEKAELEFVDDD
jgi:hypothetical protein